MAQNKSRIGRPPAGALRLHPTFRLALQYVTDTYSITPIDLFKATGEICCLKVFTNVLSDAGFLTPGALATVSLIGAMLGVARDQIVLGYELGPAPTDLLTTKALSRLAEICDTPFARSFVAHRMTELNAHEVAHA